MKSINLLVYGVFISLLSILWIPLLDTNPIIFIVNVFVGLLICSIAINKINNEN
jgi:hypothetical protein